jgi:hypothetical protein
MEKHYKAAGILAKLLDNQFEVAGIRFGVDHIIGMVPGIGDTIALILSIYIVWVGWQMKVSGTDLAKMVGNIVFDWAIGLLPILGDLADIGFKANMRNWNILKKYAPEKAG